jgi:hypothetical protein
LIDCINHPDRYAAVGTARGGLCWECYLGREKFADKFGDEFYEPGGPGRIKNDKVRAKTKTKTAAGG